MSEKVSLESLIVELYNVHGLKFGSFTMRTGEITPVYVDMRVIWSYPKLVTAISNLICEKIEENALEADHICGLPYQGIPLATIISTQKNIPMLLKRQKPKDYGTRKTMEGHYEKGQRVLLVDDVLMTGGSFVDDVKFFRDEGLEVSGAVVFCDRDQGGKDRVQHTHNLQIHRVTCLPDILKILVAAEKITQETADNTLAYLKANRFDTEEYKKTSWQVK